MRTLAAFLMFGLFTEIANAQILEGSLGLKGWALGCGLKLPSGMWSVVATMGYQGAGKYPENKVQFDSEPYSWWRLEREYDATQGSLGLTYGIPLSQSEGTQIVIGIGSAFGGHVKHYISNVTGLHFYKVNDSSWLWWLGGFRFPVQWAANAAPGCITVAYDNVQSLSLGLGFHL